MNLGSDYMLNLSYMGDTQVVTSSGQLEIEISTQRRDVESYRSEHYQLKL